MAAAAADDVCPSALPRRPRDAHKDTKNGGEEEASDAITHRHTQPDRPTDLRRHKHPHREKGPSLLSYFEGIKV